MFIAVETSIPGRGAQLTQQACHPEQQAGLEDVSSRSAQGSHRAMSWPTLRKETGLYLQFWAGKREEGERRERDRMVGLYQVSSPEKAFAHCRGQRPTDFPTS